MPRAAGNIQKFYTVTLIAAAAGFAAVASVRSPDTAVFNSVRASNPQPYRDYRFPHGPSQFLSAAATSWAVMALAPAL